jgi:hypothetical protein
MEVYPGFLVFYLQHGKKQIAIVREKLLSDDVRVAPLEKTVSKHIMLFMLNREQLISTDQIYAFAGLWRNSPIMFKMAQETLPPLDPVRLMRLRLQSFVMVNNVEVAVVISQVYKVTAAAVYTYDGSLIAPGTPCMRGQFMRTNKSNPGWYYYRLDSETFLIPLTSVTACGFSMIFCDQNDHATTTVNTFPEVEVLLDDFTVSRNPHFRGVLPGDPARPPPVDNPEPAPELPAEETRAVAQQAPNGDEVTVFSDNLMIRAQATPSPPPQQNANMA